MATPVTQNKQSLKREQHDKRELILDLCRDKDVLDLGCVQHSWRMSIIDPNWLHKGISEVAQSCVGVDFLTEDVAELNSRGFNMIAGDVLRDEPPGKFDVVVAGDLIEHLENPGIFLEYVAAALRPDGVAVVTTPSAFCVDQFWTILIRGRPDVSPEHTVIFDPQTFEKMVDRSSLSLQETLWLKPSWSALWNSNRRVIWELVGRPLRFITRVLTSRRPYLNSDFAALLKLREDGQRTRRPEETAQQVMDYIGH